MKVFTVTLQPRELFTSHNGLGHHWAMCFDYFVGFHKARIFPAIETVQIVDFITQTMLARINFSSLVDDHKKKQPRNKRSFQLLLAFHFTLHGKVVTSTFLKTSQQPSGETHLDFTPKGYCLMDHNRLDGR